MEIKCKKCSKQLGNIPATEYKTGINRYICNKCREENKVEKEEQEIMDEELYKEQSLDDEGI